MRTVITMPFKKDVSSYAIKCQVTFAIVITIAVCKDFTTEFEKKKTVSVAISTEFCDRLCQKPWYDQAVPKRHTVSI